MGVGKKEGSCGVMSGDASGEWGVAGSGIMAKRRIVQGCLCGTVRGDRVTAKGA